MKFIDNWNRWADNHHSKFIDFLRIILGLFILYKGIFFMQNTGILIQIIQPSDESFNDFWMVHYVAMSHLAGGLLITIGLLTRFAVLVQLPILGGAVIINLMNMNNMSEMIQSVISFGLILFFIFYGSGRFSADYFLGIGRK